MNTTTILPEIDLYLKHYEVMEGDFWMLTLTTNNQRGKNDLLIISNVEVDTWKNPHLAPYYFAIPCLQSPYKIVGSWSTEFIVSFSCNDKITPGRVADNKPTELINHNKVLQAFDQKQPNFELLSPGLRSVSSCNKWVRKHVKYTSQDYIILEIELEY